ncbi:MAG: hypothetical protein ACI4MS_02270 [Candidatus Coproplasma sp.]
MKRITLILFLFALIAVIFPDYAYGATYNYAVPKDRECYFCGEKDLSSALFAVPYSYCVEILRDDGEWLYVSYASDEGDYRKITGYCKSSDFDKVSSPPKNKYLNKVITVSFSADNGQSSLPSPSPILSEAVFYGTFRFGANSFSYVRCQGAFCYVSGGDNDYPLNEDEEAEDVFKPENSTTSGRNTGLILFVIILAVALAVIACVAFMPKAPKEE